MIKKTYIKDLKIGDSVFGESFAVKSFVKKASRNNRPYFDLELADRSGSMRGKIWSDNMSGCDVAKEGDVVSVNATVDEYNGPQMTITNLNKIDEYDISEFQQTTKFETEKMWKDLWSGINSVKNPSIKKLLLNIFSDKRIEKFKKSPAAYRVHHAYVGGLLEHTWEMLMMANALKTHYPKINMDIVKAGIILHDIGKIEEFEVGTTISLTDRGKLLGHIYLGAELIQKSTPEKMPKDLEEEIIHTVLSHHGEKEFGSPTPPMTTEAFAVHALDMASSKINAAYNHISEGFGNERYTPYIAHLKTELYRSPYLDELENEDIPF